MIYLAGPYSSPYPVVAEHRAEMHARALACCIRHGIAAVSPIVQWHLCLSRGFVDRGDFDYHADCDKGLIRAASEVWVLTMHGWEHSKGVMAEIEYAGTIEKPLRYISLAELDHYCKQHKESVHDIK